MAAGALGDAGAAKRDLDLPLDGLGVKWPASGPAGGRVTIEGAYIENELPAQLVTGGWAFRYSAPGRGAQPCPPLRSFSCNSATRAIWMRSSSAARRTSGT